MIFFPLLSGCCLWDPLPEGEPPQGAIVDNSGPQKFNASSAVNYMTTSLSIHLLTEPLPSNVLAVDSDAETRGHALMVLEEISRVTGIQQKQLPCAQILKTRASGSRWEFALEVNGKVRWKESLMLNLMSENNKSSNLLKR